MSSIQPDVSVAQQSGNRGRIEDLVDVADRCPAHASTTQCHRYLKTINATNTSGQDYEVVLCCLLFLRALRLTSDFYLASNHARAGRFDDVVLLYRLKEDQHEKYRAILLQAKHKDNFSTHSITNHKGLFRFAKYFKSFKNVRDRWEPSTEVAGRKIQVQEVTLVLYTNGTRGLGVSTPDVVDAAVPKHLRDLLHTQGRVQRILDPKQIGLRKGEETSDFLSRLLVCSGQFNNTTADEFLEDELRKVLKLPTPELARSLNLEFKRLVKEWWNEKQEGRYLSVASEEWNKILALQLSRLNVDIRKAVRLKDVNFSQAAVEEFNRILRATKSWVTVRDKYQTNVTKVRLSKARSKILFLDVKSATSSFDEVEALWGTAACDTIAVDMSTEVPIILLKRLETAVSSHPGRYLVVISHGAPTGSDWSVTESGATWTSLDAATQHRLLSKPVVLQGKEMTLHDVVGTYVDDILNVRVVELFFQATTTVKLGYDLPSALKYYIPRSLQRIPSDTITFDSLRNTNTLIGSRKLLPNHITRQKNNKLSKLRDLKRTGGVQGVTCINEVLSKHQFRKLCSEYGVRGIWGILGEEGVMSDMTEFISLSWTCEEKVIVVEGDPGIGKSTFVTWMCSQVKERFPEAWVLRIDMGDHSEFIKNTDIKDNRRNVKEFLRLGVSLTGNNLEEILFDHALDVSGNVFIFLDAFDEMNQDYTAKCCHLLREISEKVRFKQMVVTTRRVTSKYLEESLRTKAFSLPVFHEEEQRLFLNKLIHTPERDVLTLRQVFGPILEIPLVFKVAAEVMFQHQNKHLMNSWSPWCKVWLYELFLDKILKQRAVEKFGFDPCDARVGRMYEDYKTQQFKKLEELSAMKQIPIRECRNFHFSDKIPDDKTCPVVNTGDSLEFEHKTFAEYFLGSWLADNWKQCSDDHLEGVLFRPDMELVTSTFNWRLFEKCPLHLAVARGDVDGVRECLSSATVVKEDRGGRTALHVAALTGGNHREIWELLLSSGQDLEDEDRVLQLRAMNYAEITGHWEMVDFVLEKGEKINYMTIFWDKHTARNALFGAVNKDLSNLFQFLLHSDKQILENSFDALNNTLLHVAAAAGSIGIVKALLNIQYLVDVPNSHGVTPFHNSSKFGHVHVTRLLLENGADVNIRDKCGNVALIEAARGGHVEVVDFLLSHTADINVKGYNNNTALLLASRHGHSEVVNLLVRYGAGINMKNVYGVTPLSEASRKGHTEVVRILLQHRAGANIKDNFGLTALHKASKEGHLTVVRLLLENGAHIESKDVFGNAALHTASTKGHLEVVRLLVENGADISVKDNYGFTAMQKAWTEGHLEVVRVLLESWEVNYKGDKSYVMASEIAPAVDHLEVVSMLLEKEADIYEKDNSGVTALHKASTEGHLVAVKLLARFGADVNRSDVLGVTALHEAATEGHLDVVRMLLEKGADVNKEDQSGVTALQDASREGHLDVVRILLEKGADVNKEDHSGVTALQDASRRGHLEIVRMLRWFGADVNSCDAFGVIALHKASTEGHLEIVRMLLWFGADVNSSDVSGVTALHKASSEGHLEVVRILLEKGADVNRGDNSGVTALHDASAEGHLEVVRTVLEHGVKVDTSDCNGNTALIRASRNGHLEIATTLLKNGADIKMKHLFGCTALLLASTVRYLDVGTVLSALGQMLAKKLSLALRRWVGFNGNGGDAVCERGCD